MSVPIHHNRDFPAPLHYARNDSGGVNPLIVKVIPTGAHRKGSGICFDGLSLTTRGTGTLSLS